MSRKIALGKVVPGVSYTTGEVVAVTWDAASPVAILGIDSVERAVIVVAVCTEALGGGYGPMFNFGTDTDPNAFIDEAVVAAAVVGDTFVGAGLVAADHPLQVAVGDGGGGPGVTGAFRVTVLAAPTS